MLAPGSGAVFFRSSISTWPRPTTCPWGPSRTPSHCGKASMWRSWTRPTRCAGSCAPSPPNPAPPGRAGCRRLTWTRGSRWAGWGWGRVLRPQDPGLWPEDPGSEGQEPGGHRGGQSSGVPGQPPVSQQLSPEWGPSEAPEFPEAVSEDEYKARLRCVLGRAEGGATAGCGASRASWALSCCSLGRPCLPMPCEPR